MINIDEIIENLKTELPSITAYNGDLSDLGNEIGIIIGKYVSDDCGFTKGDFISGIKHGISLIDGSHG